MHEFITLCTGHLENIDSLSHSFLLNADTANFMIKKITFINTTTDVTRKVFKLSVLNGGGHSNFLLKKPNFYHWQQMFLVLKPEVTGCHFVHFREMSAQLCHINYKKV